MLTAIRRYRTKMTTLRYATICLDPIVVSVKAILPVTSNEDKCSAGPGVFFLLTAKLLDIRGQVPWHCAANLSKLELSSTA